MFRSIALIAALAVPMSLAAAPTFSADLASARSEAVALRASADNLLMLARTPMKYSSQAHATQLAHAQSLADRIGDRLHRMNAEREQATPAQVQEMEAMEAHVRAVARDIDAAIRVFNDRNGAVSLYSNAYQASVQHLYQGARALAAPVAATATAAD
jgi:hypothetical protein